MRWLLALILTPLLSACDGILGIGDDCNLVGCTSGIEVVLDEYPDEPFRIVAESSGGFTEYVYTCDEVGKCNGPIIFTDFTPRNVTIRLITASGTVSEYHLIPRYEVGHPNGPDCPPACLFARIHLGDAEEMVYRADTT